MTRKGFIALLAGISAWFATSKLPHKTNHTVGVFGPDWKPAIEDWGIGSTWSDDGSYANVMAEFDGTVIFFRTVYFERNDSQVDRTMEVDSMCDLARKRILTLQQLA